ncbi:MAG: hypothetical protein Q9160_000719 [Pyrenula sp. 1 TL-2023]
MSDSSALSSPPSSEDEANVPPSKPKGIQKYFKPGPTGQSATEASSPPPPKRAPSPPHEYTIADHADVAFIVMFRSRFSSAFPKSLPHYGPQDIERGVSEIIPSEHVERLLCALLGLVLNRKKDVEKGHYQRALEDAISAHSSQWPAAWQDKSPLSGGGNFNSMTAEGRLLLLKTLILWSLSSSDAIQTIIKESFKQARHDDDKNQPLSVQSWGRDGYKRKYWLVEGQDDTHFRLYRENSGITAKTNTWFSVAGTIDEAKAVADRLDEENTPHARNLRDKIRAAVPRFEAGEDKRKRRDYRLARKAAFTRPEPGFSLYEGRTRGKKMKYTFSDDEDTSDAVSTRRSNRQSGFATPTEPTVTASGRQVRSKYAGHYGDSIQVQQRKSSDAQANGNADVSNGRAQRSTRQGRTSGVRGGQMQRSGLDGSDSDEEMEDEPDTPESGHPWDKSDNEDEANDFEGDDEEDDDEDGKEGMEQSDIDDGSSETRSSLIVKLPYRKGSADSIKHEHDGIVREDGGASDIKSPHGKNGLALVNSPLPNGVRNGTTSSPQSTSSMPFTLKPTAPFESTVPATTIHVDSAMQM